MQPPQRAGLFGSSLVLLWAVLPACGGGQSGAEIGDDVGPSDPGGEECEQDRECQEAAEGTLIALRKPAKSPRQVEGGRCVDVGVQTGQGSVDGPACTCDVVANPPPTKGDGDAESGGQVTVGPVGMDCFVDGRDGTCLFGKDDFVGCTTVDDPCPDICAELNQRYADDAARSLDAEVIDAVCDNGTCHHVVSIEGQCYADGSERDGRAYDCSLSAEDILQQEAEASLPEKVTEVPSHSR